MARSQSIFLGASAMAFAVGFNAPYAVLAVTFDYPAILREPASDVLIAFSEGGPHLIFTWYAFMAAALLFVPLAIVLSVTRDRLETAPAATITAAAAGILSGALQAVGLSRWVFAIPGVAARAESQPDTAAAQFDLLNAWGGVAIGEHLGQLLLALFLSAMAILQMGERRIVSACLAILSGAAIAVGTGEGLALALNASGAVFSLFTIGGFLAFSLWLAATGLGLIRAR